MSSLSESFQASVQATSSISEFGQKGLRSEYANSLVFPDGDQVFAVSGDEHIYLCFDGAGEDQVVVRIAGQGFGFSRRCSLGIDRDIGEQRLDFLQLLDTESEFLREDPDELDHCRFEQHEVQVAVNGFFNGSTWWPSGNEG